jgi:hypothetical protein
MLVYTVRNSLLMGSSSDQWLRFPYISVHFLFGCDHELHMLQVLVQTCAELVPPAGSEPALEL